MEITKIIGRCIQAVGLFILISLSPGCNYLNKEEDIHSNIPQEMKAAFYYQPGTYWIMVDSATGAHDSMYVTNPANEYTFTQPGTEGGTDFLEKADISMQETGFYNNAPFSLQWEITLDPVGLSLMYGDHTNATYDQDYLYCIKTPIIRHSELNTQTIDCSLANTLMINGTTYDKVYITTNRFKNGQFATTFMNFDVGLIKIIQQNDTINRSISLISSHIVK